MAIHIQRRDFITLLGGAAATWPLVAHAQQRMPVIGFLRSTSLTYAAHLVTAFRQGLKGADFAEGQNVAVEYHPAENHPDRLPIGGEFVKEPFRKHGISYEIAKQPKSDLYRDLGTLCETRSAHIAGTTAIAAVRAPAVEAREMP